MRLAASSGVMSRSWSRPSSSGSRLSSTNRPPLPPRRRRDRPGSRRPCPRPQPTRAPPPLPPGPQRRPRRAARAAPAWHGGPSTTPVESRLPTTRRTRAARRSEARLGAEVRYRPDPSGRRWTTARIGRPDRGSAGRVQLELAHQLPVDRIRRQEQRAGLHRPFGPSGMRRGLSGELRDVRVGPSSSSAQALNPAQREPRTSHQQPIHVWLPTRASLRRRDIGRRFPLPDQTIPRPSQPLAPPWPEVRHLRLPQRPQDPGRRPLPDGLLPVRQAGQGTAFTRTKLKNMITGSVIEHLPDGREGRGRGD